jgi:hypothetical protein
MCCFRVNVNLVFSQDAALACMRAHRVCGCMHAHACLSLPLFRFFSLHVSGAHTRAFCMYGVIHKEQLSRDGRNITALHFEDQWNLPSTCLTAQAIHPPHQVA